MKSNTVYKKGAMQAYEEGAEIFKALSEPMRLLIIDLLSCREMCACKILERLSITQSTLSHHMKVLMDTGLVTGRKEATWMHYKLNREMVAKLQQFVKMLTREKEECICNTGSKNTKNRN